MQIRTKTAGCLAAVALFAVVLQTEVQLPKPVAKVRNIVSSVIRLISTEQLALDRIPMHFAALEVVMDRATPGDPDSVLQAIDDFGWEGNMMINIGNVKGKHLDDAAIEAVSNSNKAKPMLAVEFGTFLGYGSVRLARHLPPGGKLITVDPCTVSYAVSSAMIKFAGLEDKVEIFHGYSTDLLVQLAREKRKIDFLFFDHLKHLYLPDFQLAENLGVLADDAVIFGDNVKFPGAPKFLAHMKERSDYNTTVHETFVEYNTFIEDYVTVSVRNSTKSLKIASTEEEIQSALDKWQYALDQRTFIEKLMSFV